MRRFVVLCVMAVVAAATFAATGAATPPTREPAMSGPIDFPAGIACSFPVHGDVLVNRQKVTTFSDGTQLVTGAFVAQLTNVSTGNTITINVPGSLEFSLDGDIFSETGRGRNIYFFFPGDLGPGAPGGLFLINGLVKEQFSPTALISFSYSGSVTDLCAVLAG